MRRFAPWMCLACSLLSTASRALALPTIGAVAPDLLLEPVEGQELNLASARGRPALIFYESRASHAQNNALKKRLKELVGVSESYRDQVVLFPIANLEGYDFWPVRGIVAGAVRTEAKRIGAVIYCDWKGAIRTALGVHKEASSIILINRGGKVIFAHEGALLPADQDLLLDLLRAELSV